MARCVLCNQCAAHKNLPFKGKLDAVDENCSHCGYQVVEVTNPATDKKHFVCPACFDARGCRMSRDGSGFRCFACKDGGCPLQANAVREDPIRQCPKCRQQQMKLKKGQNGKYRWALYGTERSRCLVALQNLHLEVY